MSKDTEQPQAPVAAEQSPGSEGQASNGGQADEKPVLVEPDAGQQEDPALPEPAGPSTAEQKAPEPVRRDVAYKAEWQHPTTNVVKMMDIESLAVLKAAQDSSANFQSAAKPEVMEVITRISTRIRQSPRLALKLQPSMWDDESLDGAEVPAISDFLEKFEITEIEKTRIVIHSEKLLNALRRLIRYYPYQALTGDMITIKEPYECLIHFYDRLEVLSKPCGDQEEASCSTHGDRSLCDEETKKHIEILLKFLEPTIETKVKPARLKLKRTTPVISYDMLWLLFQPGTEVVSLFAEREGTWTGSVELASTVYGSEIGPVPKSYDESQPECFTVQSWLMCSDGDKVGRTDCHSYIRKFEGWKEVNQLEVYPITYAADKERRNKFIERGKLVAEILKVGSKPVMFDGIAYKLVNQPRKYKGKAIIDTASIHRIFYVDSLFHWSTSPSVIPDRNPHLLDLGEEANIYSNFDSLKITSELTEKHYLHMFPFLGGIGLDDKIWRFFDIGSVHEFHYDREALGELVLDKSDQELIKAITYRQLVKRETPSVDFIEGKGQGQVILLHGPPGVGKTYTVEAIAGRFGRPLLGLSFADIGLKEEDMERNLKEWFDLANTWNAVVLIDEADVVLERRSKDSVERNGFVSIFLRKLEYFRGLLFLTTNRVIQIDDSFASRIHAKIEYPRLDDKKRKLLWEAFFKRMETEAKGRWFVAKKAKNFVLSDETIAASEWNGREIRNAFQTAIALAEFEAFEDESRPEGPVQVDKEHFMQVMEMSKKFTKHLNRATGQDEDGRAALNKDRPKPAG